MIQRSDISVSVVALGCSKNLVDAECMSTKLREAGYTIADSSDNSQVVIINTCGFIEAAKKEAIDAILKAGDLKYGFNGSKKVEHIIVTGCLSQRYPDDILKQMPEVDIVLGTSDYGNIVDAVDSLYEGKIDFRKKYECKAGGMEHLMSDRDVSTSGFAWLKIGEGCLHRCSFCAIPLIRGSFVSRPMEDILAEAKAIAAKGYKEIVLTAQDTTNYGIELYKKRMLPELLDKISKIEGIEVIRVLYGYMDGIDEELLNTIKDNPKVAHYLDIPIQHGCDRILKAMRRHDTVDVITNKLEMIRKIIPDITIRSTVLVGFPGETEEDFNELLDNLKKWKFDRLGCFAYSPEEDTPAFDMPDQVDEETKAQRVKLVYETQYPISMASSEARVGEEVEVTIDSVADDGIFYVGRSYAEAPDDDPVIYVAASDGELQIGSRYKVRLVESRDSFDMTGVTI
ncbi:MAG: 30S ribosomal protein S12 methylthiotransferase RimO [Clostridiales bacterium]|nr:30S ribosomal protein S12 methylthiotransferase RimO [Clostridiales bacterium]